MPRAYSPSRAVRRWLENGLSVSPETLEAFRPDASDLALARVMQDGALDLTAIRAALVEQETLPDLEDKEIRRRMMDPVRAAWYNQQIVEALPHKIAGVYWQLLRRALAGQVDAARLFLTRFDPRYRPTTRRESISAHLDARALSDEDLQRGIVEKLRQLLPSMTSASVDRPGGGSTPGTEGVDVMDAKFEVVDDGA